MLFNLLTNIKRNGQLSHHHLLLDRLYFSRNDCDPDNTLRIYCIDNIIGNDNLIFLSKLKFNFDARVFIVLLLYYDSIQLLPKLNKFLENGSNFIPVKFNN